MSSIIACSQSSIIAQEYTYKCGYKENINKLSNSSKLSFQKGSDGVYCIKKDQYETFIHLMKNLPHDIKWKMVIDEKNTINNDCMIFDHDRIEGKSKHKGEPGYHDSVLEAWEFMSQKLSNPKWDRMDADKLQELHDIGIMGVDNKKIGYYGATCYTLEGNSTFKGMLEFLSQKDSGLEFEKILSSCGIQPVTHCTTKRLEGGKNGIFYEFCGADPFMNVVNNKLGRKNCSLYGLRFKFGDRIESGSDFVNKVFLEYNDKLEKIKSQSTFNLPKVELSSGYKIFEQIINDNLINGFWIFYDEDDPKMASGLLKFIKSEYEKLVKKDINNSSINEKVIELIVRVCRALDQAHVFPDGNLRVCRLLMNMLLIKNGMLPALFNDFNTLDFFDIESLVNEVKEGQQKFLDLLFDNSDMVKNMVGIELIK